MLPAGSLCVGPGEPDRKASRGTLILLLPVTSREFPCGGLAVVSAEGTEGSSAGRQSSLETAVPTQDRLPSLSDEVAKPLFLTPFPTLEGLPIDWQIEVDHGVIHGDLWIRHKRQNENTRSLFYRLKSHFITKHPECIWKCEVEPGLRETELRTRRRRRRCGPQAAACSVSLAEGCRLLLPPVAPGSLRLFQDNNQSEKPDHEVLNAQIFFFLFG